MRPQARTRQKRLTGVAEWMPTTGRRTVVLAGLIIDETGADPIRDGAIVVRPAEYKKWGRGLASRSTKTTV